MDKIDAKLLAAVQRNNQQTAEVLSQEVGLSPSACLRRLQRLRRSGAIIADVAVVSPKVLGLDLVLLVSVKLAQDSAQVIRRFKDLVQRTSRVAQAYLVTGDTDFVLLVHATDMTDYDSLAQRILIENPDVRSFQTTVVIDRIKGSVACPVIPELIA